MNRRNLLLPRPPAMSGCSVCIAALRKCQCCVSMLSYEVPLGTPARRSFWRGPVCRTRIDRRISDKLRRSGLSKLVQAFDSPTGNNPPDNHAHLETNLSKWRGVASGCATTPPPSADLRRAAQFCGPVALSAQRNAISVEKRETGIVSRISRFEALTGVVPNGSRAPFDGVDKKGKTSGRERPCPSRLKLPHRFSRQSRRDIKTTRRIHGQSMGIVPGEGVGTSILAWNSGGSIWSERSLAAHSG